MLRTYLQTALRTLARRPVSSTITILGLAVGLAVCLLIGRSVADAWRFDAFHTDADRIVRISSHLNVDGDPMHLSTAQGPLAEVLANEASAVEAATRLIRGGERLTTENGETTMDVDDLLFTGPAFFDVFSFSLLQGDPSTALSAPNTILLTPPVAKRLFGTTDVVGRSLTTDDGTALTVTGLLAEAPATSHIAFPAVLSMETRRAYDADRFTNWGRFSFWTYAKLAPGTETAILEDALESVQTKHMPEGLQAVLTYEITPLREVYLHGGGLYPIGPTGDPNSLHLLLMIAAFVLAIACVNFVNLATARSVERAREVGVRKTLGAARGTLVGQFLLEAILTAGLAMLGALGMARLTLPVFETLSGTELAGGLVPDLSTGLVLLAVPVGVGLLAGAYPATVLAGYRPARVLRGTFSRSSDGRRLRQALVVGQFAIAIVLLAGTGVVHQQLQYVQTRDLGFASEQLVALNIRQDPDVHQHRERIKRELTALPGVEAATASLYVPGAGQDVTGFQVETPSGTMQDTKAYRYDADEDFLSTYGIPLLAGRGFSADRTTDATSAVVINAAAAQHFGYSDPADAVGATVRQSDDQPTPYRVIGVVENFHYDSFRSAVDPLIIVPLDARYAGVTRFLTLRVSTDRLTETMDAVQARWTTLLPDRPYEATFVDGFFAQLYAEEQRVGRLVAVLAGIAILVACLGLFGLATHTVQQRRKELGIRKVLGATAASLVGLLTREVAVLVGVAFVLAVPAAYVGMRAWLAGFAYHVDLGAGVFLGAGFIALTVALATIGTQAWRAARQDPTRALQGD